MSRNETGPTGAFVQDRHQYPADTHSQTNVFSSPQVVVAPRQPAAWRSDTIKKLENLATLGDNWDSYGADQIDVRSISHAKELVSLLSTYVGVESPAVGATPDGEVGLSWDGGHWSLDAEINKDGRIDYVYIDDRNNINDVEKSTHNLYDLLMRLTQWPEATLSRGNPEEASWARVARRSRKRWLKDNPY